MNDRLDERRLHAMVSSPWLDFDPLPDETTYSYVTRAMHLSPLSERAAIVMQLFGRRSIDVTRSLHVGFGHFAEHLHGVANCLGGDAIESHSMLALFSAFAKPSRYERARQLVMDVRRGKACVLTNLPSTGLFRTSPAVCLACIKADRTDRGFSIYRRSHQVSAAKYCASHRTPLLEACERCAASFSHWTLPTLVCESCGEPHLGKDDSHVAEIHRTAQIKLSSVIAAALAGRIRSADVTWRLAALRRQTLQVIKNRSGVVGDNLATHLNCLFGKKFLGTLGLTTSAAPTLGWPALLIHGHALTYDPIPNALLITALFDSIDDYSNALAVPPSATDLDISTLPPLMGAHRITFSMLRASLREPSPNMIAKHRGLPNHQFERWYAAYPGLSERRSTFRANRNWRSQQKAIQTLESARNARTRCEVDQCRRAIVALFHRHGKSQSDKALLTYAVHHKTADHIQLTRARARRPLWPRLLMSIHNDKAKRCRPALLTLSRVIHVSKLDRIRPERRHNCPTALVFVLADYLCEDDDAHRRRCLAWAAKMLASKYGKCNSIEELFNHARVRLHHLNSLERFAQGLLVCDAN